MLASRPERMSAVPCLIPKAVPTSLEVGDCRHKPRLIADNDVRERPPYLKRISSNAARARSDFVGA